MAEATVMTPGAPANGGGERGLVVSGLSLGYRTPRGLIHVLRDIHLRIAPGEVVGLVGESGSGKSTLAYATVRYLSPNAEIVGGEIRFDGEDLLQAPEERLTDLRGTLIGMVYQDPATALNPTLRLGEQLMEGLIQHERLNRSEAEERAEGLLSMVHLPDPRFIMKRFPHEVSGGEKQRVLIAMAFACRPRLLIFDEPTTALDATTAAGILELIGRLQEETHVAVLYITHDVGNVAAVAQRVNVIYAGQIVEEGAVDDVLWRPRHPYTRILMASVPNPFREGERRRLPTFAGLPPDLRNPPAGCIFQSRCPFVREACREGVISLSEEAHGVACLRAAEIAAAPLPEIEHPAAEAEGEGRSAALLEADGIRVEYGRRTVTDQILRKPAEMVKAVTDVSLTVGRGKTIGLVGESGCGKSTLARSLVGLTPFSGAIRLDAARIESPDDMTADYRRAVQIVFQHPDLSLNPRMRVEEIVGRPLRLHESLGGAALKERVRDLLEQVRLPEAYARRYPHELSGGEKQRVAIARAFGPKPQLVICDEITSGLDVSVQASILNLLADLQDQSGTAYLFITHDLNLVRHFADEIVVMYLGRIVERRPTIGDSLRPPFHPYTEALLSAVPVPEPSLETRRVRLEGALPSPKNPPGGCVFHTRCPRKIGGICEAEPPPLMEVRPGHGLACHIPVADLARVPPIWSGAEPTADDR